jgi:hypothetical protein
MTVRYFEELEIWKEARRLTGEIYRPHKDFQVRTRLQSYGTDSPRGYFHHVEYCRRFRARREPRVHPISLYREGFMWRGPITGVYSI